MASSLCERKTENKAAAAAGSHTLGSWIWLSLLSVDLFAKYFAHTTCMLCTINLATNQDLLYIIFIIYTIKYLADVSCNKL